MFLTENIKEDSYYNLTYFSIWRSTSSKTNETERTVMLNTVLKSPLALSGTLKYPQSTALVGFDLHQTNETR